MEEQSVVHSTFVVERSFRQAPERVFAAFADPGQRRRWYAEGENHDLELFEMDFRTGGAEATRYKFKGGTPVAGMELRNEGQFLDIVPDRRIVSASGMWLGGRAISASLVTIELLATEGGTDLICTHQGAFYEGSDGPEMREAGWRTLLERLEGALEPQ